MKENKTTGVFNKPPSWKLDKIQQHMLQKKSPKSWKSNRNKSQIFDLPKNTRDILILLCSASCKTRKYRNMDNFFLFPLIFLFIWFGNFFCYKRELFICLFARIKGIFLVFLLFGWMFPYFTRFAFDFTLDTEIFEAFIDVYGIKLTNKLKISGAFVQIFENPIEIKESSL